VLHPSKFFEWCAIRTSIDMFEIFDDNLKQKLMNIQPKNFIKSKIVHPVYEVKVGYETGCGNYKESTKYMIMDNPDQDEYSDFWADMFVKDYEREHKESIKNIEVLNIQHICDAVLRIG
jgi:hypothetical protein